MQDNPDTITYPLAVVDDHGLFRHGLVRLIQTFGGQFPVVAECCNGRELLQWLEAGNMPAIVLMDINMPEMGGYETTLVLQQKYPGIKVIALTMMDAEEVLIKMIKAGVKGFLGKDVEPQELLTALKTVASKGYYYNELVTGRLVHSLQDPVTANNSQELSGREKEFLEHACSELTYKEIADKMCLSIKTVDGYRNNIFEKLGVKSRVGMVLYAIRNKLVVVR